MANAPNPEAIAWYVRRAEELLDDLRERVQLLRTRGGQLAGFSGVVLALAGANVVSVLSALHGAARACAGVCLLIGVLLLVAASHEPDLWRVHVRMIRSLLTAIELTTVEGDEAARSVRKAEYSFLTGLFSVGVALGILIAVVTF